jgi:hypothetical protein
MDEMKASEADKIINQASDKIIRKGKSRFENEKTFTSLKVYENIFPTVVRTLKLIESLDQFKLKNQHLLQLLNENCIEILSSLADGYNKYHTNGKVKLYNKARSCISRVQSLLLILYGMEVLNKKQVFDLLNDYEDSLRFLNGLIKKMEKLGENGGGQIDANEFESFSENLRFIPLCLSNPQKIS